MYIESVPNRNSPPAVLLRESYRRDGKVKKRTLANLSKWPPALVEGLRVLLKGGAAVTRLDDAFDIVRALPHGHVAAVLGTLRQLRLERLVASRRSPERDRVVATGRAHRGRPVRGHGLAARAPDRIERSLAKRHLADGALVLYDLTSVYLEGRKCPLAKRGHSRDGKKGKPQIEFGLLCDADGRPVAVRVFSGNTADPATVGAQVDKLRERFGLSKVVLVGDRGMLTEARIREDVKPAGLDWIGALRGPAIRKLVASGAIQLSLFDRAT